MKDQAESLRRRLEALQKHTMARTIAVLSGKGGVGKSNFSLNFSIALSKRGKKVLLFDMDIGMGNIDILIGGHSPFSIIDFFENGRSLQEIITDGPGNISIITGGTGLLNLFSLDEVKFARFNEEFSSLMANYDYILFDMGAGITHDSLKFLLCVDELFVITTPEPTSITDAYSAMKYIHSINKEIPCFLVCNRICSSKEGKETIKRLQNAFMKFLDLETVALGYVPDDRTVSKAVSKQMPFILFDPEADVSRAIMDMGTRYANHSFGGDMTLTKGHFLRNMKRYFLGK
ncbi:MinD/ParA family protein [Bacillus sp. mrc49]|uniref:MinD/ParA family protein n=1 Tax=Bacillus sp. mrc49 TaxID=2054913 RepID=UPI000C27D379|nr:MinD/ParA family protein [Bacillus sp. mrc49]PJN87159.1 cobyrinic acid a,c-diamide synthase [Bacillus sp. mrc49]